MHGSGCSDAPRTTIENSTLFGPVSTRFSRGWGQRSRAGHRASRERAKIESAMDRAAEQALRAGQIIRRLRYFVSRGESEKRVESLSKLIEAAGALGLTGTREQNVQLRFNLDPEFDLILADRVQIRQVLVNLFRNALEAMAQSPRPDLIVRNAEVADDMIEKK